MFLPKMALKSGIMSVGKKQHKTQHLFTPFKSNFLLTFRLYFKGLHIFFIHCICTIRKNYVKIHQCVAWCPKTQGIEWQVMITNTSEHISSQRSLFVWVVWDFFVVPLSCWNTRNSSKRFVSQCVHLMNFT